MFYKKIVYMSFLIIFFNNNFLKAGFINKVDLQYKDQMIFTPDKKFLRFSNIDCSRKIVKFTNISNKYVIIKIKFYNDELCELFNINLSAGFNFTSREQDFLFEASLDEQYLDNDIEVTIEEVRTRECL